MKKFCSVLLAFVMIFCLLPAGTVVSAEDFQGATVAFYVAPDGNDANAGTIDAPLATLAGARDKVRKYKAENGLPVGGINVFFRGGYYQITEETLFEAQDSGSKESPIAYKAYPGENPIFTGGQNIEGAKFVPVTDQAILNRFPTDDAKANVMQYDLKANGITDYGQMYDSSGWGYRDNDNGWGYKVAPMEVSIDDDAMLLSRWPNPREDGVSEFVLTGEALAYGRLGASPADELPTYKYLDERIEGWATYDDVCLLGTFKADYAYDDVKLESVDKENNIIKLKKQVSHGVLTGKKYFYYNVLDELDIPGEYYIDRVNGILYLYPTKDLKNASVKISGYNKPLVVNCKGLSFVTFSGLTFEQVRGSVFNVVGGDSVTIAYCTMRNLGVSAVFLGEKYSTKETGYDNAANGVNHKVIGCEVKSTGFGGITIVGGNIITRERANFTVENCKIHDIERRSRCYMGGINYNGYGFHIAHNEIFDSPHSGLIGSTLGTTIEYNELYDLVKENDDAGAMYCNYSWPIHDLTVRYNYIHDIPNDIPGVTDPNHIAIRVGIYFDCDTLLPEIYGNVLVNIPMGFLTRSKAETIQNNIFVDCRRALSVGGDYSYFQGMSGEEALATAPQTFGHYKQFPFEQEPWKSAYPELTEYIENFKKRNNASLWDGKWINNLIAYDKLPQFYKTNHLSNKISTVGDLFEVTGTIVTDKDLGFVDAANGNYQLKDDAEFYNLVPDFEKLDIRKMGLLTERVGAKVNDAVVLQLGTPNALVKGGLKAVDKDNPAVMPAVVNDRTLVPVRFISESFGGVVGWDEATQTVTIDIAGRQVTLVIGDNKLVVDGTVTEMDVTADTINDRTMIPLRALAEVALGKNVFWDDRGLIVISDGEVLNTEADADLITEMINSLLYR